MVVVMSMYDRSGSRRKLRMAKKTLMTKKRRARSNGTAVVSSDDRRVRSIAINRIILTVARDKKIRSFVNDRHNMACGIIMI